MEHAGSEPIQDPDLAEAFFPAASERMGTKADTTALGCLLLGLATAAVLISWNSGKLSQKEHPHLPPPGQAPVG